MSLQRHDRADRSEIDLVYLTHILVDRRLIVAITTFIFTLGAVMYFMLAHKVYRVEAKITTLQIISTTDLDVSSAGNDYDQVFLEHIGSAAMQAMFLKANGLEKKDFGTLKVKRAGKADGGGTLSLLSGNSGKAAELLNEYIKFVDLAAVRELVHSLRHRLEEQRAMARETRDSRIIRLREALAIARSVGFASADVMVAVADTPGSPLYMRGAEALEAEIQTLQARKNDDAFGRVSVHLKSKIKFLESLGQNQSGLRTVTVMAEATPPTGPVKPKPVIILFGLMGGLMLGILAAFTFHAVQGIHNEN